MSDQLRATLRDLADQQSRSAPDAGEVHDLWRRGRLARRRRVAGSVLATGVVVALLGALGPVVGVSLGTPEPASYDESRLAVPDRIWIPNSWAPEAGEGRPSGPLALVGSAPRLRPWLVTTSPRWFGVSAADQSYRWLDFPGQADEEEAEAVSLSPDGRRLAYVLGGTPSGSRPQSDAVGVAVLDLETGEVTERAFETRFGIRVEHLVWSGDSRWLVTSRAQYVRMPGASSFADTDAWDPATGDVTPIGRLGHSGRMGSALHGVATWRERMLLEVEATTGEVEERRVEWWWKDDGASGPPVYNRGGSFVAWTDGRRLRGGTFPAVYAASVSDAGELGRPVRLDLEGQPQGVLGWTAPTRVLVETSEYLSETAEETTRRILAVDVDTGEVTRGIDGPASYDELHAVQLATDLLERPLVPGDRPGWLPPLSPLGVAVLLLLTAALAVGLREWRTSKQADR